MSASGLVIRPVGPDERAAWEPLWQGYLTFYESSVSQETSDVLWKRLHDPAEPMHLLGSMVVAVRARPLERGRAIGEHDRGEAEVGRRSRRRRHALIGRDAGDDDGVDLPGAKVLLQGRPDEGAVHGLLEDRLSVPGRGLRLECIAGPIGPQR